MIAKKSSHETPYFCFICGYYCDIKHKHSKKQEWEYDNSHYSKHFKPSNRELTQLKKRLQKERAKAEEKKKA